MLKRLIYLALVITMVSLACGAPLSTDPVTPAPSPRAVAQLILNADPNATATPTPFLPLGPTPTRTTTTAATLTQTSTSTPGPTATPTAPSPTETLRSTEGMVNILVMGNDFRPGEGYRTDVIMFVSVNTDKGTVSVISFPRDLYITIPGWMEQRINTAFPHGGFPLMADTLQYNFGIRPKYYIMTNFQGFSGIINGLGGISVNAGARLSDKCDLPQARGGYCTVNPGVVQMDGATALWYVRSRHTTSDFDRTRRAQEVLYGMFNKLMSINAITRLPQIYSDYRNSVETNMSLEDILPLVPVASQILSDSSRVHRYGVTPNMTSDYITSGGAMVLLPNYNLIKAMLNEALYGQ